MKRILAILIVLFSLLILSACVDVEYEIDLYSDAGGCVNITAEMDKSVYDNLESMASHELEEIYEEGFESKEFKEDGVERIRFTKEIKCDTDKELSSEVRDIAEMTKFSIKRNTEDDTITVEGAFGEMDVTSYSSYILSIKMPGNIQKIDGCGAISDDSNREFLIDIIALNEQNVKELDFKIVSSAKSFNWLIVITACFVVLLAVVALSIGLRINKRKKIMVSNTEISNDCNHDETSLSIQDNDEESVKNPPEMK